MKSRDGALAPAAIFDPGRDDCPRRRLCECSCGMLRDNAYKGRLVMAQLAQLAKDSDWRRRWGAI